MKLGSTDINKLYLGSTEIKKAYLGSTVVFDSASVLWTPADVTTFKCMTATMLTPSCHI